MYKKIRKLYNIRKRIITALFIREAKSRFGNNQIGLMWAVLEPAMQVGFFAIIFIALGKQGPHGSNVFTFLLPGVIIFQIFSKTLSKCMEAINANRALLSYPIMKPFDTIFARGLLEFITYLITFFISLYFLFYFELIEKIYRLDYFIIPIILSFIIGIGLGTLIAALSSISELASKIVSITNRFLFIISGIFYSASMLPQFAREFLLLNPILQLNEMIRYSLIESFPDQYFNISYTVLWSLCSMTAGLLALYFAERNPNAKIRGIS